MKKFVLLAMIVCFFALFGCGKTKIDENNIEYVKITPTPTITSNNVDSNQNKHKQDEQNINTNDNPIDNVSNNIKENEDVIDSIKEHQEDVDIKNSDINIDIDEWGIALTTSNVTPTSVTINCSQKDGQYVKELITGSFFCIQKLEDGEWVDVPYKDNEIAFCWTAEAWIIPLNDNVSWDVNWDWIYGELSSGEYRIGKEIMIFRKTGDYDESIMYANFIIE